MTEYDWVMGLGISFFVAIVMTIATSYRENEFKPSGKVFFIFLTIGMAFSWYAQLIEAWYFILSFIATLIFIIFDTYNNRG